MHGTAGLWVSLLRERLRDARNKTEQMRHTSHILIVEDDADQLQLFSMTLAAAGYTYITAEDAETALSILGDQQFDLLLTDYKLPGIHGDALITVAQEHYPGMKTILMSNQMNVREIAEVCGADAFLPKGDIRRMTSLIGLVLRGKAD